MGRWRSAVKWVGAMTVVMTTVAAPVAAWARPSPGGSTAAQVIDLGVAMRAPNVRMATTGQLPDGTPVAYAFSDGQPVSFNVINLRTGALVHSIDMAPYTVGASLVVAPDGTVFLSVRAPDDGSLWHYDPGTRELRKVATGIVNEQILRSLVMDGTTLYGSTYPEAKVYSLDTTSGATRDYGSLITDGDYAWGFDLVDGKLWVGTGAVPHLFTVDPASGAKTELPLPPEVAAADFINKVARHGDLVFLRYTPGSARNNAVYDLTTGQWCCTDAMRSSMGVVSRDEDAGRFFYASGSTVFAFDNATRQTQSIGWESSPLASQLGTVATIEPMQLGTPEFPGTTLVGVRKDGSVWRYNLTNRTGDSLPSSVAGAPVTIHSVGNGPDGNVYFGAFLSPGVASRVNRATQKVEQLGGPEQAESFIAHGNQIVISEYPGAGFNAGTLDQPWVWGTNPRHLFTLGRGDPFHQDRPVSMVSAGPVVAAGTVPNYGELGGALVLFDPATAQFTFHRNVVPDQSVTALAYRDGLVYGGTSIFGGLDIEPTATQAELFVWDVAADRKVASGVVVPGATVIDALAFGPDDRLWGLTDNGILFAYDTNRQQVTSTVDIGLRNTLEWGHRSELYYRPQDGKLYGNVAGRLFRFHPPTRKFEILVDSGVTVSGINCDGDIYFANNTNVFQYRQ